MDTPERIWSIMETENHLDAAHLYTLSHTIYTYLRDPNDDQSIQQAVASFPLLSRQWDSIKQFPTQVASRARHILSSDTMTTEACLGSLTALGILEHTSSLDALNLLLNSRVACFRSMAQSSQLDSYSAHDVSTLITRLLSLVRSTVFQTKHLFQDGVLADKLRENVTDVKAICNRSFIVTTMNDIVSFDIYIRPLLVANPICDQIDPSSVQPLSDDVIAQHVSTFITQCTNILNEYAVVILHPIHHAKQLLDFQLTVLQLINSPIDNGSNMSWSSVSQAVTGQPVPLWSIFADKLLPKKAEKIILHTFHSLSISESIEQQLNEIKSRHGNSLETRIGDFVWKEIPNEPRNVLSNKSNSMTPVTDSICKQLDNQIDQFVTDLQYLLQSPFDRFTLLSDRKKETERNQENNGGDENGDIEIDQNDGEPPYDPWVVDDRNEYDHQTWMDMKSQWEGVVQSLHGSIQDACVDILQSTLASSLKTYLENLTNKILEPWIQQGGAVDSVTASTESSKPISYERVTVTIDLMTFIGRIMLSIVSRCRRLRGLLNSSNVQELLEDERFSFHAELRDAQQSTATAMPKTTTKRRKKAKTESSEKFASLVKEFQSVYLFAYGGWARCLTHRECTKLSDHLRSDLKTNRHRDQAWPDSFVASEDEQGNDVEEVVKLPTTPSPFVSTMLFGVCEDINRVGGHSMEQLVVRNLIEMLSDQVLQVYTQYEQDESLTELWDEPTCVQMLFDLYALRNIFFARMFDLARTHHNRSVFSDQNEDHVILASGDSDRKWRIEFDQLISRIENRIDPIDFNFFESVLKKSVPRYMQRTAVLYGPLTSLNISFGNEGHKGSSKREEHNVMPLVPQCNRFSALPTGNTNVNAEKDTSMMGLQGLQMSESSSFADTRTLAMRPVPQTPQTSTNYTKTVSFVEKMVSSLTSNDEWGLENGNGAGAGGGSSSSGTGSGERSDSGFGGFFNSSRLSQFLN
eukprot:TRINITY_DN2566_c2_g1_i1.p1 TRINITY_DN2566_c2_g1~~TRINITY_DN2566_c2_g1_i1.p1  ORF type:complete len:1118 (+),score=375.97 TRINITY_DN2566_c2_g1_i1:431-3355(+)